MKTTALGRFGLALAMAAMSLAACNPFQEENTSAPQIKRVLAINATFAGGVAPAEVDAPQPGTDAWVLAGVHVTGSSATLLIVIRANELLDGASIQATPYDCTPAANSLTVSVVGGAPGTLFTCYDPSSPTPEEGGAIWAYLGTAQISSAYHITGQVKDHLGRVLPVDVTVTTVQ